jgi:hypothetical protein
MEAQNPTPICEQFGCCPDAILAPSKSPTPSNKRIFFITSANELLLRDEMILVPRSIIVNINY